MKEHQIKSILKKGSFETSADFTDGVMSAIEATQKVTKRDIKWSFTSVLLISVTLVLALTFLAFNLLNLDAGVFTSLAGMQKTPIFIGLTLALLCTLNGLLKMSRNVSKLGKDKGFGY